MRAHSSLNYPLLAISFLMVIATVGITTRAESQSFKRIQMQWIAALGAPDASSGNGAEKWGLWQKDPGPRGVWLKNYEQLKAANGIAPARWKFDKNEWWLEEHGLIMEKPSFPLSPGKYVVTGGRRVTAILTIHPKDQDGIHRWELDKGTLSHVTHLPCRSARYTSHAKASSCTPANAQQSDFPVKPGAEMPPVEGCSKQDYAVLFVIGVSAEN